MKYRMYCFYEILKIKVYACFIVVRLSDIKRLETTSVGRDVVRKELSFTVAGNVIRFNFYGKQYGYFS